MYDFCFFYFNFHTDKLRWIALRMSDFDCKVTAFLVNGEKIALWGGQY